MGCQWSRNVNTWLVNGVEMLIHVHGLSMEYKCYYMAYQWSRNVNTWLVNGVEMLIHWLSVE